MPQHAGIKTLNRGESETFCNSFGGKLADISDLKTYHLLYNYVRKKHAFLEAPTHWYIHVWLASDYNPETGIVTQSNGEPGYNGEGNWRQPYNPNPTNTYTELFLRVRFHIASDSGLLNYPPTQRLDICTVLCTVPFLSDQ
uniref:uncharacterized protein LOC113474914 n=1 Tax=Ciona intestinalis TaxID=7719 RepID=UPI000EF460BC|nr:uncharacterized protein LOC113474914 [Ciona intestinalis]|eukprot:XP_026693703.1 uncharacterized protein LOC113474914 [Ciona intestinalis]